MEIDPRLRSGSDNSSPDGAGSSRSCIPASSSRHVDTSASSSTEFSDPSRQFSARQPSSIAPATRSPNYNNISYGATQSQSQSTHAGYQREQLPQQPSAIQTSPQLDSVIDPNDPYSDLKRPRACEACRQLKVRCEPDLVNPDGSCRRCAKSGRSCIVTVPTRKRQKKTDSRVAELERKIDALTASLQASQSPNPASQPGAKEHVGRRWLGPGQGSTSNRPLSSSPLATPVGSKRHHSGELKDVQNECGFLAQVMSSHTASPTAEQQTPDAAAKQWHGSASNLGSSAKGEEATSTTMDIIERGLVSPAIALEAFTRYVDKMSLHIPMVVFPPGTQMKEVRQTRPVLFQAIVAVAVGPFDPEAQIPILNDLYRAIAERVIVKGEKSLDLVQALLVSCTFYTPPENFEEIKFYQLAQLAVSVGMDIGMYRKSPSNKAARPFNLLREMTKTFPVADPDSPEIRRTWLGCYFLSVQYVFLRFSYKSVLDVGKSKGEFVSDLKARVSTALRRPILVRWLPYMDECVDILQNSPNALPSDKAMIQWAKLVRLIEEISLQFFSDDPVTSPSFCEPKFQFTLKAFEKQLEQWRKETPPEYYTTTMQQAEAIVGVYLNENAMNMDNSEDKASSEDISNPNTAARVSALSGALTSIHRALDAICSIETRDFVNLPTISLARTSFAVVALIKLYSIVAAPDSYIGQVIEPGNLRVEYYLDKVINLYSDAGKIPGGVTPAKFSTVLAMLREWFMKRKDQTVALKEAFHGPRGPGGNSDPDQDRNQPQDPSKLGHTPLQLLSEVAMGEPKTTQSSGQQQQHQHLHNPYTHRPGGIASTDPVSQPPTNLISQPVDPGTSATADSEAWAQYPATTPGRQFYPPFSSDQQGSLSGYPDPSGSGIVLPSSTVGNQQGIFVPELGIYVGYDPENLFALGNMLGDGIFNLPLPADMGFF